jgi:hypothetical protein
MEERSRRYYLPVERKEILVPPEVIPTMYLRTGEFRRRYNRNENIRYFAPILVETEDV